MTTTIVIFIPIHGIYHVLEARAITASWVSVIQAPRMRPMGVHFPTSMWQGLLLISTHSPLVDWHISATLVHGRGQGRERLIHLLYPWETLKSYLWEKMKLKDILKISGSMRRGAYLFGQHSVPSVWNRQQNKHLRNAVKSHLEVVCLTLRNSIFEYQHSFTEDSQVLSLGILEDTRI